MSKKRRRQNSGQIIEQKDLLNQIEAQQKTIERLMGDVTSLTNINRFNEMRIENLSSENHKLKLNLEYQNQTLRNNSRLIRQLQAELEEKEGVK
jgi:Co/Zn/Cd efflux system component